MPLLPCLVGIHVVCRRGNNVCYLVHNLSSAKLEQESLLPTDTQAFLGHSYKTVSLHNAGEVWLHHSTPLSNKYWMFIMIMSKKKTVEREALSIHTGYH